MVTLQNVETGDIVTVASSVATWLMANGPWVVYSGVVSGTSSPVFYDPSTGVFAASVIENRLVTAESSVSAQGIHRNTDSATYGKWYSFGNAANSAGFAGSGSPAEAFGALVIYQKFGDQTGGTATPITKTTQAAYVLANYYGPTIDDSMEGLSVFVGAKDVTTNYTQSKPITGFEAICQVEAGNTADSNAPVRAIGARVNASGTGSSIHTAEAFYMSVNATGGPPFGAITNFYGLHQPVGSGATNAYGVYTVDKINSETGMGVGRAAGTAFEVRYDGRGDGPNSLAYIAQPVASYGTLSGTYTLTTTPQTLTTNGGATLPAGGGTFMLDSTARTIVTYTSFSGTSINGATIASGSVATTNGQTMVDPNAANVTGLRINAHLAQSKNTTEWYDGIGNLRLRVNPAGNLVTQGTDFFAGNGSGTTLARISGTAGYVQPGTTNGLGGKLYSGSGVPSTVSGSAAGDFFFRTDTPSTANQRIYVATAANTWTALI